MALDLVKRRTVQNLVSKLSSVSEQSRTDSICELRLLSKNDPDSRPLITEYNAVPLIAETLYSPAPVLQENATATLLNISISCKHDLISCHGVLDALSHALRHASSPFVVQCAAATLFSLMTVEEYREVIGHKRDIIFGLVEIVKGSSSGSVARSVKDALRALFGIALCAKNRGQLVELGAVHALFGLVVKDGRVGLVEDSTAVIAQLAGCGEAWEAFRKVSGVEVLVDLLDYETGSSARTRENAVSALLNLVRCGGEGVVREVRGKMEERTVDGIVDVARNGSEKAKEKARALMNAFGLGVVDDRLEDSSSHSE